MYLTMGAWQVTQATTIQRILCLFIVLNLLGFGANLLLTLHHPEVYGVRKGQATGQLGPVPSQP